MQMLVGDTPFYAETLLSTYGNIMNYETSLQFPEDCDISDAAKVWTCCIRVRE